MKLVRVLFLIALLINMTACNNFSRSKNAYKSETLKPNIPETTIKQHEPTTFPESANTTSVISTDNISKTEEKHDNNNIANNKAHDFTKACYFDKQGKVYISDIRVESAYPFSDGMAKVSTGGKYGFIDKTGKIVIEPRYSDAKDFAEGYVPVKENKWYYIDKTGKKLSSLEFEQANVFSEGLASVKINGKYGFINKSGEIVIKPQFDEAYAYGLNMFKDGLALINANGKFGFIDKSGSMVIKTQYSAVQDYYGLGPFKNGIACVDLSANDCIFIDKEGKQVFDKTFNFSEGFKEDFAVVMHGVRLGTGRYTNQYGFIDKSGNQITEMKYNIAHSFSDDLAQVGFWSNDGQAQPFLKIGYIDKKGTTVIEPKFGVGSQDFSEGLAVVEVNAKYGYIDKGGNLVIKPTFDQANKFTDGIASVKNGDKWAIIDKTGKIIVKLKYEPSKLSDGLILGVIDVN